MAQNISFNGIICLTIAIILYPPFFLRFKWIYFTVQWLYIYVYDVVCVSVHAHASTDTILKTQLCITYVYIIHKMYIKCIFTHGNQKLL